MNQTNGATYDTEWCNTRFETNRATRTGHPTLTGQFKHHMNSGPKVTLNKNNNNNITA